MARVKDNIQRLESVFDSKFEKIHAGLQKHTQKKSIYENFESKVVDLRSEFSKQVKRSQWK
jgi:hypothetical protein